MAYQSQHLDRGNHDAAWLSMLVCTMEKLSAPDWSCDEASLIEVEAHLARPMQSFVCAVKVDH